MVLVMLMFCLDVVLMNCGIGNTEDLKMKQLDCVKSKIKVLWHYFGESNTDGLWSMCH